MTSFLLLRFSSQHAHRHNVCMLQVLRHHHNFVGPNCPYIFMDKEGRGFTHSRLSTHWTEWLDQQAGCKMPPSQCRQVFVDERRSDNRAEGPSDQGAAHIMGHSVSQWDKWYDTQFYLRQGQSAVNAMDEWRQNVLRDSSFATSQTTPQEEQVCTELESMELESEDSFQSCASNMSEDTEDDVVIELD